MEPLAKREQGVALILVALVVAALAGLGAAVLTNVVIVARITHNQQRGVVLQYLAEAGVERMRAELAQNVDLVNLENSVNSEDARYNLHIVSDFGEAEIISILQGPDSNNHMVIFSTARLPDGFIKTVQVNIKPPFNQAVVDSYSEVYMP